MNNASPVKPNTAKTPYKLPRASATLSAAVVPSVAAVLLVVGSAVLKAQQAGKLQAKHAVEQAIERLRQDCRRSMEQMPQTWPQPTHTEILQQLPPDAVPEILRRLGTRLDRNPLRDLYIKCELLAALEKNKATIPKQALVFLAELPRKSPRFLPLPRYSKRELRRFVYPRPPKTDEEDKGRIRDYERRVKAVDALRDKRRRQEQIIELINSGTKQYLIRLAAVLARTADQRCYDALGRLIVQRVKARDATFVDLLRSAEENLPAELPRPAAVTLLSHLKGLSNFSRYKRRSPFLQYEKVNFRETENSSFEYESYSFAERAASLQSKLQAIIRTSSRYRKQGG